MKSIVYIFMPAVLVIPVIIFFGCDSSSGPDETGGSITPAQLVGNWIGIFDDVVASPLGNDCSAMYFEYDGEEFMVISFYNGEQVEGVKGTLVGSEHNTFLLHINQIWMEGIGFDSYRGAILILSISTSDAGNTIIIADPEYPNDFSEIFTRVNPAIPSELAEEWRAPGITLNINHAGEFVWEHLYKMESGTMKKIGNIGGKNYILLEIASQTVYETGEYITFQLMEYEVNAGKNELTVRIGDYELVMVLGDPFETGTVTDIAGNQYNTVKIGEQWWMQENLKTISYNDGTSIQVINDPVEWMMTTEGAFAVYPHEGVEGINSEQEMISAYGVLYNWYAVGDERGICPAGWHVPDDDEWSVLIAYLGGRYEAGGKLKSRRTEPDAHPRWDSPNREATNESGFTGLPAGYRTGGFLNYIGIGWYGYWWSSSESAERSAWYRAVHDNDSYIYGDAIANTKTEGMSVRCVKD